MYNQCRGFKAYTVHNQPCRCTEGWWSSLLEGGAEKDIEGALPRYTTGRGGGQLAGGRRWGRRRGINAIPMHYQPSHCSWGVWRHLQEGGAGGGSRGCIATVCYREGGPTCRRQALGEA